MRSSPLNPGSPSPPQAKMDQVFERNRKVRGSSDFVYDVRVDFEPTEEANEWDD